MIRSLAALAFIAWSATALAYGESKNGRPNMEERLLHVLTNQVRQAPHAWAGWDTSLASAEARGPLYMQDGLYEAGRFHADDMADNNCFMHESCDGTTFESRLSRYFGGPAGENIYMGHTGFTARDATTGWMNSTGHRMNILESRYNLLGTGFSQVGQRLYYVQDFGIANGIEKTAIPAAAIEVLGGGKVRLLANYFEANNFPPMSFIARVGSRDVALEKISGANGHATYQAMIDEPADCTTVLFIAGATTFPSTGALLTGTACTDSFQAGTPPPIDQRPVINADDEESGCTCVTVPRDAEDGAPAGALVAAGHSKSASIFSLPLMLLMFVLVFVKKIA